MFTNRNMGRTQTEMGAYAPWLSSENPVSQIIPFSGGLAGYLWFVCILVMTAAGGGRLFSDKKHKQGQSPLEG